MKKYDALSSELQEEAIRKHCVPYVELKQNNENILFKTPSELNLGPGENM